MPVLNTTHHDELELAIQQNLTSLVLSSQTQQIRTQSLHTVTQSWSSVPFPYFNIVCYANVTDESHITEILQPYRTPPATAVWFRLSPSQPENLDDQLIAHGLMLLDVRPCMAVEIDAIISPETNATIVRVQDEAQCRDWVQVQASSNGGFPATVLDAYLDLILTTLDETNMSQAFVAYENGQAVACSLLHLGGGVAGIWQVGTIPEARRKGYGSAITYAPLLYAAQLGYKISVLIATQMGRPVYQKMGFQEILQAKVYLFTPK
jgi:GNAT superfamily N-acetyltransferase